MVQPNQVEEVGTLVPSGNIRGNCKYSLQCQDSPFSCLTATRYFCPRPLSTHWHAVATKGVAMVGQEARECIVSIANLLDHFRRRTKLHEEELWAHSKRSAEGFQVVRLVEPWISE